MSRPDPRFKISPDGLEHLAFTTPKATVEFTPDVAYLAASRFRSGPNSSDQARCRHE